MLDRCRPISRDMASLPNITQRWQWNLKMIISLYKRPANLFSDSTIVQAQKQNNAIVKGDVGFIGLTKDPF